jgi:hypothetical protein
MSNQMGPRAPQPHLDVEVSQQAQVQPHRCVEDDVHIFLTGEIVDRADAASDHFTGEQLQYSGIPIQAQGFPARLISRILHRICTRIRC